MSQRKSEQPWPRWPIVNHPPLVTQSNPPAWTFMTLIPLRDFRDMKHVRSRWSKAKIINKTELTQYQKWYLNFQNIKEIKVSLTLPEPNRRKQPKKKMVSHSYHFRSYILTNVTTFSYCKCVEGKGLAEREAITHLSPFYSTQILHSPIHSYQLIF